MKGIYEKKLVGREKIILVHNIVIAVKMVKCRNHQILYSFKNVNYGIKYGFSRTLVFNV